MVRTYTSVRERDCSPGSTPQYPISVHEHVFLLSYVSNVRELYLPAPPLLKSLFLPPALAHSILVPNRLILTMLS